MAITFPLKAPDDILDFTWQIPLDTDDSIVDVTAVLVSGTIAIEETDLADDLFTLFISAGATGETAEVLATVTTASGREFTETLYFPIGTSASALANTGQTLVDYVLRKVAGVGEQPDADEADDALERLSDMLASWKQQGADIGVPLPLTVGTELRCDDAFISAIKANGIIAVADLYEFQPSPFVVEQARRGLALVKNTLLNREPVGNEYY